MTTRNMSRQNKSAKDAILIAQLNELFPYNNATMPGIIDSQRLYQQLRELKQKNNFKGYRLTVFETNNEYGTQRYAVEMSGMITDIDVNDNSVDIDGDTHFISNSNAYKIVKVSGGSSRKKHRKSIQRRNKTTYKQKRLRKKSKKHRY